MASLRLSDFSTRAVLRQYGLTTQRRLGRGKFCAVYDDGPETVIKLTADPIQLESVRDYLKGIHYPKMVANLGCVGEQHAYDMNLYLFKSERLKPTCEADLATRRLARTVIRTLDTLWSSDSAINKSNVKRPPAERLALRSAATLEMAVESQELPLSTREALQELLFMMGNYNGLTLDFHGANLMVRGTDELVFNDVVVDAELLLN